MAWTRAEEAALRAEVERRFRERTPTTDPNYILPETRVGRFEMVHWCADRGHEMPAWDEEWCARFSRWYRAMSRRVRLEAGEPLWPNERAPRSKGQPTDVS